MDIAPYINELLDRDQLVYVPGLGSFFTRKTPGVYNQLHQKFYPPVNTIDFLQETRADDTLKNHISADKNISAQAAGYFIDKYVDQLLQDEKTQNRSVKEALLSDRFPFSAENNSDAPFNKENFGLPQIDLLPIKQPAAAEEPAGNQPLPAPEKDYVENFYREFSQNIPDERAVKSRKPFWGGLIFLLAICLFGCYALYLYYPDIFSRVQHKNSAPIVISPAVNKPDTNQNPAKFNKSNPPTTYTPQSAIKKDTVSAQPKIKKTVRATNDAGAKTIANADIVERSPYEIIGAAFKTLTRAENFVHQLKNRGMVAHILQPVTGRPTMVTFGSFNDKDSAKTALQKLHAKDIHSEAYIQHYNK